MKSDERMKTRGKIRLQRHRPNHMICKDDHDQYLTPGGDQELHSISGVDQDSYPVAGEEQDPEGRSRWEKATIEFTSL